MDEALIKMLAGLNPPAHKTRFAGAKFTPEEFHRLQSYCAAHYLNLSDVIRTAVATMIADNE